MSKTNLIQLFQALGRPGEVPDWVHLLPAGDIVPYDGRGPFRLTNAAAVIAASMAKGPLPIDQDHATDLSKTNGGTAPARGWIVAMEAREDGIWGRVEWTETGKALLSDRAYRGLSPVILFDKNNAVTAIRRAGLTNDPALDQLTTLMSGETQMDWKQKLIALFGLSADASDEEILAAVEAAANTASAAGTEAMSAQTQAQTQIATLTATVTELQTQIATLSANGQREEAIRVIDGAIAEGKPIKPQRDVWISLFVADPEKTKAALAAIPSINGEPIEGGDKDGCKAALSAEEEYVVALMGLDKDKFLAARQDGKE